MKAVATLLKAARRVAGEQYRVDEPIDDKGQYQARLEAEFPLAIKRIWFSAGQPQPPLTWHTYLELFVLLSPECRFQLGGTVLRLARGDVLVMDHLKLHAVIDFPSSRAEAVVVRFLPEVVRGLASQAADHLLLLPFYCQIEEKPHVLRGSDARAADAHFALARLLECYAQADRDVYWQTGSRGYFLEVLHHLARHFRAAERLKEQYARDQPKSTRLRKLFEHIEANYASRISLPEAAAITGLSKPQFHAVFKKATGTSLVAYLTQVRLAQAARRLKETDGSIAEIASQAGFADQSYFDRRFRQHFGRSPLQFRRGESATKTAG